MTAWARAELRRMLRASLAAEVAAEPPAQISVVFITRSRRKVKVPVKRQMRLRRRGTHSLSTHRGRKPDSNLYGAFSVKLYFWFVAGSLFGAGKPFFVASPAIRIADRAEGVKGPKR